MVSVFPTAEAVEMIFIDFKRGSALVVKRAEGKSARRAKLRQFKIKSVKTNEVSEVNPVFYVLKDIRHISLHFILVMRKETIQVGIPSKFFGGESAREIMSLHKYLQKSAFFEGKIEK